MEDNQNNINNETENNNYNDGNVIVEADAAGSMASDNTVVLNSDKPQSQDETEIIDMTREEFEKRLKQAEKKGKKKACIAFLIVLICLVFAISSVYLVIRGLLGSDSKIADKAFKIKAQYLWDMIDFMYLWDEDIDAEAARDAMYKGMFESLGDIYSTYYTKEEFSELTESFSGEYSGIGAYISQNVDTLELFISRPMPGSPAEEAGLLPNDYIYEVDGENVEGQDINVVVSKIKGPEGTTVKIGVKHDNEGEIETYTVDRRTIEVAMVESEMLDDNIGRIWILEFEGKTVSQFNKAYDDLKAQGMEGLIIDLRDNPGGDVEVVSEICDKFLDEGIIFYTKNKYGKKDVKKSDAQCEEIPMIIITNENSASASEIMTGALKDRGIATIVGKNTYGKGIVQSVLGIQDGSGFKVTEAEYYLPKDECIHGVGIAPDIEVELDVKEYRKNGTDAQKDKAIEVMKEMLEK